MECCDTPKNKHPFSPKHFLTLILSFTYMPSLTRSPSLASRPPVCTPTRSLVVTSCIHFFLKLLITKRFYWKSKLMVIYAKCTRQIRHNSWQASNWKTPPKQTNKQHIKTEVCKKYDKDAFVSSLPYPKSTRTLLSRAQLVHQLFSETPPLLDFAPRPLSHQFFLGLVWNLWYYGTLVQWLWRVSTVIRELHRCHRCHILWQLSLQVAWAFPYLVWGIFLEVNRSGVLYFNNIELDGNFFIEVWRSFRLKNEAEE